MKPYKCPVCDGAGHVQRPPWVAGDQHEWSSGTAQTYPCKACAGTGPVWDNETARATSDG